MPFRTIPGTDIRYGLICFDARGQERTDDPDGAGTKGGLLSARILEAIAAEAPTNIFIFIHGWRGDVPAAARQYDSWIGAFHGSSANTAKAAAVFPGFRPLFIGLHWPSEPWGDEEIRDASFSGPDQISAPPITIDSLYESYVQRLGDSPEVRGALRTIFDEARINAAGDELPDGTRQAFLDLEKALELKADGVAGAPDADREPFEIEGADSASFGSGDVFDGVLGAVRLFSYWTMKKRARAAGEGGMHNFVRALQQATAAPKTRIHLMGHSFGCVVVSSILGGPGGEGSFERPIDSVLLAQGAVSLWSYASSIPYTARRGYFHKVIAEGRIAGPLVTTRSRFDLAVGDQYPRASWLSRELDFADPEQLPKYGAVGTFGVQGIPAIDREMLPAGGDYRFERGKIYNLQADAFISKGAPPSGAHNDIAGPEVAHAIWEAAFASAAR